MLPYQIKSNQSKFSYHIQLLLAASNCHHLFYASPSDLVLMQESPLSTMRVVTGSYGALKLLGNGYRDGWPMLSSLKVTFSNT